MSQARSRAIDRLRFESRKKRSNGGDVQSLAEVAAEALRAIGSTHARRAPGDRNDILCRFSHAEAAARLNQPLGTIKTRIRSRLHKLRTR